MKNALGLVALLAMVSFLGGCSGDTTVVDHSDEQLLEVYLPWADPQETDRRD